MKRNLELFLTFFIGVLFGLIYHGTFKAHTEPEPIVKTEYVYIETEPEVITETVYIPYEEPFYRNLTEEDKNALLNIAVRESEGESVIGQAMVMYCVICRAESFGKSIKEVTESSAFESSRFRSGHQPNDNTYEALALIEEGWTPKPMNFRAGRYHDFGTPLFQVGNHYFSE